MEFTWERGPFSICAMCSKEAFGFLSVEGKSRTMRCSSCRYLVHESLPPLDKKVIYLDQFVFSLLFNVESGGRLPKGHEAFAKTLHKRLRRLVLLQQIVLPHSNIHHDETTVFHRAIELRQAYELIGGDVSLIDTFDVELRQTLVAAEAFLASSEIELDFSVDGVIANKRNQWLPRFHISVRADYNVFAAELRRQRDETHTAMMNLAEQWAKDKPSFMDVLRNESGSIMSSKHGALRNSEANMSNPDPIIASGAHHALIQREARALLGLIAKLGIPEDQAGQKVMDFWSSKILENLPHNRISSYLFAGVARRVVQGQKTIINKGLVNDVRAISSYAPYVDAMFIDKDCAGLLSEGPLVDDLEFKARIFSFTKPDAFLAYLDEIEASVPPEVKDLAQQIYGLS